MNWLKYSGIWIGIVINPFHWKLKWETQPSVLGTENVFENCLYCGPFWIRIIIDDGRW